MQVFTSAFKIVTNKIKKKQDLYAIRVHADVDMYKCIVELPENSDIEGQRFI